MVSSPEKVVEHTHSLAATHKIAFAAAKQARLAFYKVKEGNSVLPQVTPTASLLLHKIGCQIIDEHNVLWAAFSSPI